MLGKFALYTHFEDTNIPIPSSARIHHNMLMLVERVIQSLVDCQMKAIKVVLEHFGISHLYKTDYRVHVRSQASSSK